MHQAIACAEAKVTLISPFVGRILDWYKKDTGKDYQGADDPGVQSVTKIYNYFKKFGYKTVVMGASFRNIGEIESWQDAICSPLLPSCWKSLNRRKANCRASWTPRSRSLQIEKIPMDKEIFEKMHAEDRMAHDKLKEGIEGFSEALVKLEKLLADRLAKMGESERKQWRTLTQERWLEAAGRWPAVFSCAHDSPGWASSEGQATTVPVSNRLSRPAVEAESSGICSSTDLFEECFSIERSGRHGNRWTSLLEPATIERQPPQRRVQKPMVIARSGSLFAVGGQECENFLSSAIHLL